MTSRYNALPRFVYLARGGEELTKIGLSINPTRRMNGVSWITVAGRLVKMTTPEKPQLIWQKRYAASTGRALERCIKHRLQHYRAGFGNEWFTLPSAAALKQVLDIIKRLPRCTTNQADEFITTTNPLRNSNAGSRT